MDMERMIEYLRSKSKQSRDIAENCRDMEYHYGWHKGTSNAFDHVADILLEVSAQQPQDRRTSEVSGGPGANTL